MTGRSSLSYKQVGYIDDLKATDRIRLQEHDLGGQDALCFPEDLLVTEGT